MKITLSTLPQATPQLVFDQAVTHLLTQRSPSLDENGGCTYHGMDGKTCPGGCFITPEQLRSLPDGAIKLTWAQLQRKGYVPKEHAVLLNKLQEIHDTLDPDDWEDACRYLASEFHLLQVIVQ